MSKTEIGIKNKGISDWWLDNRNIEKVSGSATPSSTMQHHATLIATILEPNAVTWHIPRPSLVGRSEGSDNSSSWIQYQLHSNSSSSSCTSSQASATSTHSAASGTTLLTATNLANFTATQQPIITTPKSMDTVSIASSTHFTVVNGIGKPTIVNKKSWCARNQLTFLVSTMSILFMIGLLVVILIMEMRVRDKYD